MKKRHSGWAMAAVLSAVVFLGAGTVVADGKAEDTAAMENLLTTIRSRDCFDYVLNAMRMIPRLHAEGKTDSIDAITGFVAERCRTQQFDSYLLLRDVQNGVLDPDWCDDKLIEEMLPDWGMGYHPTWMDLGCWIPMSAAPEYEAFIADFAGAVQETVDPASTGHAIALYYAEGGRSLLRRLADDSYQSTCLQGRYDAKIDSLLERRRSFATNWSVQTGGWIPTGNLDVVGRKIELGGQAGVRSRRLGFDLTGLIRFLKPEQTYIVRHKDSLYESDHFFSVYLGVDPVLRVFNAERTAFELFGGVGYDGIMALNADDIDSDAGDYLHSLNLNFGMTFRWLFGERRTKYVGIQARYNVIDFDSGGGTDLSGNSVSVNLLFGSFGHGWTDQVLDFLGYFDCAGKTGCKQCPALRKGSDGEGDGSPLAPAGSLTYPTQTRILSHEDCI